MISHTDSVIDPNKVRETIPLNWNPPSRRACDFSTGAFYPRSFRHEHTLRVAHKSSWLRLTRVRAIRARRVAEKLNAADCRRCLRRI